MIPNAWYSIIELRLILARRPCCMPRSKRRMATFGDGYASVNESVVQWKADIHTISTSTFTSRMVNHGINTLLLKRVRMYVIWRREMVVLTKPSFQMRTRNLADESLVCRWDSMSEFRDHNYHQGLRTPMLEKNQNNIFSLQRLLTWKHAHPPYEAMVSLKYTTQR